MGETEAKDLSEDTLCEGVPRAARTETVLNVLIVHMDHNCGWACQMD